MKTLTALIAALSLFTIAGSASFAGDHTHCKHEGNKCVSVQTVGASTLTEAELLR